jgi:hypothetical protein
MNTRYMFFEFSIFLVFLVHSPHIISNALAVFQYSIISSILFCVSRIRRHVPGSPVVEVDLPILTYVRLGFCLSALSTQY